MAPGDFHFIPRHADHFSRDAIAIVHGFRAQIADAGMDMELAVGRVGGDAGDVAVAVAVAGEPAPLTHGRGFFVVPVAVLVLVIVAVRARPPLREMLRLGALAAGIVLACVAVAFLYTRSHAAGAFGSVPSTYSGGWPGLGCGGKSEFKC